MQILVITFKCYIHKVIYYIVVTNKRLFKNCYMLIQGQGFVKNQVLGQVQGQG